ncbi:Protein CBG02490 [Caenorhabditis briggsae]|uniref:Protein CBG02490 n=1 Tax=Caenorhabditis briggsae TaxID=6238 RepID=A8WU72_CAEBR|nr:Protein CBG02490 [Caenorhabditis briggsae]CAP24034.2 Protein CBG02490 [Caenorhabditis briggsae]
MVLIYGNVSTANWASASNESQDSCISKFYYQTACFLAFMNSIEQCLLFNYISTENLIVVDSKKSKGLIVAIKVFTWSDGYTTVNDVLNDSETSALSGTCCQGQSREDCLIISRIGEPKAINDVECDSTQYGFVCGYQLA